ncbi:galactosyldiacylglycerol synthase [Streptomyces sp. RB6PN25]|uniref:Galactosyldiacylglycerol synthase n=2 Tax=Streptomyces humicola TaxID=2953240 RepID=A0ABT1Q531_9ACTN|nr:galactosyldiacylglycerol synthase [Streptomyces humicola]
MILSAGMGAGHDAVADELAHRLAQAGHATEKVDVLRLLPAGTGSALRRYYAAAVQYAPWTYDAIYEAFFVPRRRTMRRPLMSTSPLVAPAATALRRHVERGRPDTVISTFHLAAQMCGRLRDQGALPATSVVVVTDFAVHRQWFHPGNDMHLCPTPESAATLRDMGGRGVVAAGPVVPEPFFRASSESAAATAYARRFAVRVPGATPVLVSAGAWGVGSGLSRTAALLASGGYLPVVLCGHNKALRRRLVGIPGVVPLGWVTDVPELMTAVRALVENAAGQTAAQALAVGLPVVNYRTIAGHGTDGARRMAAAGLSSYVRDPWDLMRVLDELTRDGPLRGARVAAGKRLFTEDAAALAAQAR